MGSGAHRPPRNDLVSIVDVREDPGESVVGLDVENTELGLSPASYR
jgi:hypothetical protein